MNCSTMKFPGRPGFPAAQGHGQFLGAPQRLDGQVQAQGLVVVFVTQGQGIDPLVAGSGYYGQQGTRKYRC